MAINDLTIWSAAYSGALSGMANDNRANTIARSGSFTNAAQVAAAFATAFDSARGVTRSALTDYEVMLVFNAAQGFNWGRYGLSTNPAAYATICQSMVTVDSDGYNYATAAAPAGLGLTLPLWPGNGASIINISTPTNLANSLPTVQGGAGVGIFGTIAAPVAGTNNFVTLISGSRLTVQVFLGAYGGGDGQSVTTTINTYIDGVDLGASGQITAPSDNSTYLTIGATIQIPSSGAAPFLAAGIHNIGFMVSAGDGSFDTNSYCRAVVMEYA